MCPPVEKERKAERMLAKRVYFYQSHMGLLILCILPSVPLSRSLIFHFSLLLLYSRCLFFTNPLLKNISERNREKGNWNRNNVLCFNQNNGGGGEKIWKKKTQTAGKNWHLQHSWQTCSYKMKREIWKIWQGSNWHLLKATHVPIHLCLCLRLFCLPACLQKSVCFSINTCSV